MLQRIAESLKSCLFPKVRVNLHLRLPLQSLLGLLHRFPIRRDLQLSALARLHKALRVIVDAVPFVGVVASGVVIVNFDRFVNDWEHFAHVLLEARRCRFVFAA